jgi:peptidase M28-like protein/PDZ domain-containing protein
MMSSTPTARFRFAFWLALAGMVICLALRLGSATLADPTAPPPLQGAPVVAAEKISADIRYLASRELEGRGSGTPGGRKAAAFIAERFGAVGLQPLGDEGSYFQPFHFTAGVRLGQKNALTLQRAGKGAKLERLPVRQGFMPLAFSRNGTISGPLVFVGYGISAPRIKYDDYAGLDVRGKIVVALRQSPEGDDLKSKFAPFTPLRSKAMTAREKGAVGILLVTGPLTDAREDLGVFRYDASFSDSGIGAAVVHRAPIEALLRPGGRSLSDLQLKIAHTGPQSFAIPGARAVLTTEVEREERETANVLGLLPGSDPALRDEVVLIGAHYDHLGYGGEGSLARSRAPQIHYGADDNASGTSGVIELAAYFAAQPRHPARSLLFASFSGEELGLLGSSYYVKHPPVPLARTVAMINMDMVGRLRNDALTVIGAGTSPAWDAILKAADAPLGLKLLPSASGFGASDQTSFYAKDIPVLFFFTGVHPDYHTPTDTWEKINAPGEATVLTLVADVARRIADDAQRPRFVRADTGGPQMASVSFNVYLGTIPDYSATVEGVQLTGVREGSPAEKAGIRGGDIIIRFGGKAIKNIYDYTFALRDARAGIPVNVTVRRGGQTRVLRVVPARRPG